MLVTQGLFARKNNKPATSFRYGICADKEKRKPPQGMLNFNTEFLFGPTLVELLEIGSDEIDYNVDIDMGEAAGEVRVGK